MVKFGVIKKHMCELNRNIGCIEIMVTYKNADEKQR